MINSLNITSEYSYQYWIDNYKSFLLLIYYNGFCLLTIIRLKCPL